MPFPSEWNTSCKEVTYSVITYVYEFRMEIRLSLSDGTRCIHVYTKYKWAFESNRIQMIGTTQISVAIFSTYDIYIILVTWPICHYYSAIPLLNHFHRLKIKWKIISLIREFSNVGFLSWLCLPSLETLSRP